MNKTYVAFLRGINVGGRTKVSMERLKEVFTSLGFSNLQTILNSGNVIFEAPELDTFKLEETIAKQLAKTFGLVINVLVRSGDEIQRLISDNPFAEIHITPQTRLYVTFLPADHNPSFPLPYTSPDKDFNILKVRDRVVISVLELAPKMQTTEAMKIIETEFGKQVTSRNWNTIVKIGTLLRQS